MVRWLAVVFLGGHLLAQSQAPMAQSGSASPQSEVKDSTAAIPESSGFPFDSFPEFSAIMVGSVMVGDSQQVHIYRSGKLLRTQGAEGIGYFITNLETSDVYGLTLTGCMHDTHPYMRAFPFTAARKGRKVERVAGGEETVDGHVCKVEDVTISSGGLVNPMKLRFWEAEDLHGFPIKVEIMQGPHAVIRYKDVRVGPQDPTLFIHPNVCKGTIPRMPDKLPITPPKAAMPKTDSSSK